ncbi:CaiB/BaiF CoA transferase family protein [Enterovirga sp. CN4-39]|uniref:CaiB/BaiF CoA transferase family protein n=1 Tax=Enterovirga sp. CN4-39 TaxID=3400910 RepID=UPI003C050E4C
MLDGVLKGIRVIDLTQNVAGPYCTQVLGDLGAEVIKVERPGRGDDTRDWRPPSTGDHSATFLSLNRNKRSICIDLDNAAGVEALRTLIAASDVVIHSMKPGSAEARGLGYDALKAANPKLIYCAISAFGSVGPLKNLPGYDPLMQAFTGIMSTTGHDGDDPVRVGVSLIDLGTGMWSALGILAAIIERGRSGEGALVEASLLETGTAWMTVIVAAHLATGKLPRKLGSATPMTAPYRVYRSADGHVFIAAGNNGLFRRVCEGLGAPELAADPRFASNPQRLANRDELDAALEALTRQRPTGELVASLQKSGAPCSELNDVGQLVRHEQVAAMELLAPLPVEGVPDHKVIALPIKANGARSRNLAPPPALGADTEAVLLEIGLDEAQIERLRAEGAAG